jgi:ATP-dependent RNA helicase DHX29
MCLCIGAATVAAGQQSDHLCLVAAYDLWQSTLATKGPKAAAALCSTHFLHQQTLQELKELRGQLAGGLEVVQMVDAALVPLHVTGSISASSACNWQ